MNRLSFELVEQIASYLDAGDALSLSMVCRATREGSLSRLNPETYLQTTFKHAKSLLAAMTDHGCVLSGSRALEYFVPGSIDETALGEGADPGRAVSDWDFLVPCARSSVYGMMAALEASGVEWNNPLAALFELPDKPAGTVAEVPVATVSSLSPEELAKDTLMRVSEPAKALYRFLYDYVEPGNVRPFSTVSVQVLRAAEEGKRPRYRFEEIRPPWARDDDDDDDGGGEGTYNTYGPYGGGGTVGQPIKLINGTVRVGRDGRQKTAKVQLFQCHLQTNRAATPLEYVLNTYYATHVQCFLSGWCAGHFYYGLARERLALLWDLTGAGKQQTQAAAMCVRKYRRRGFRFFAPEANCFREHGDLLARTAHLPEDPPAGYVIAPRHDMDELITMEAAMGLLHIHPLERGEVEAIRGVAPPDLARTPRTGPLAWAGYESLLQASRGTAATATVGRLGKAGTLLIRFGRLQAQIEQYAPPGSKLAVARHYRALNASIRRLRFMRTASGRVAAVELPASDLLRPPAAPVLVKALAWGAPASAAGVWRLPPRAAVDEPREQQQQQQQHYLTLLRATPTTCPYANCESYMGDTLPPQI